MYGVATAARKATNLILEVFHEFSRDECIPLAGSLAFFTLFSFGPILALVVDISSMLVEPGLAREQVISMLAVGFGTEVADHSRDALTSLHETQLEHPVARVGGIALLLFAATMVLAQAQQALNRVWAVERRRGFGGFLLKRLVSLGVILGLVVVLLFSVVISTVVGALGPQLDLVLPEGTRSQVIGAANAGISFALLAFIAALVNRVLPEARIAWSDAAIGGLVTAILLTAGHAVIGWILSATSMVSAFGAARSLALLLFWVFYSSAMVLWGAEFTKVVARRRGHEVVPERGARRSRPTWLRVARIVRIMGKRARPPARE